MVGKNDQKLVDSSSSELLVSVQDLTRGTFLQVVAVLTCLYMLQTSVCRTQCSRL